MSQALGNNGGRLYSFAGQPVLIDCNFVINSANTSGTASVKGQGVQKVFCYSSAGGSATAIGNPLTVSNASQGYALIQLTNNYNRYLGGFIGAVAPVTGSNLNIDATHNSLTVGTPYIITAVGAGPNGTVTIAPVADVSGSLASKYFTLWDSYGNTWIIYFVVAGVGFRPNLGVAAADGSPGLHYVQMSIASGATAATIGGLLATQIAALQSGIASTFSFTASGTTTVTVVSTMAAPLPGVPQDGVSGSTTGFTFAVTVSDTNLADWQGVGLPKGLTPTVGQSFVATATGAGASTGTVKAVGTSKILQVEVIGDPNASFAPQAQGGSANTGAWIMVQFMGLPASGQTPLVTQPINGSVVGMSFYVDQRATPSNTNVGTKL